MCFSQYNSHTNKMLHSSVANLKACTYAQVTNYLIHNTHTVAVKGCTYPLNKSPPLSPPSHASSLLPPQAVFVLSISGQVQSGCGRFLGQRCLCNSCLGNFTLLFMSSPFPLACFVSLLAFSTSSSRLLPLDHLVWVPLLFPPFPHLRHSLSSLRI